MERQSSMASSTEEVSGPDLSAGSQNPDHFGVFKDFDFLEYESESVEGESTDNFNWGVRRRPLSEGEGEGEPSQRNLEESLSEKTPVLSSRKIGAGPEESSDDEVGSESPLDEMAAAPEFGGGGNSAAESGVYPPLSLNLRERRDSGTRSDTSGSSAGDLGDLTPCNASPNLSALMSSFRPITRDETEEAWRQHIQGLLAHVPASPLNLFHLLHRVIKDVLRKSVCLTREACHYLSESGVSADQLTQQLASLTDTLALHGDPPLVWFSPERVAGPRLAESLRFGMLELKEHLDTFLDRKDHAAGCLDSLKAVGNKESVLDVGRSLYKLHFQLLLLLESATKMFTALCSTAHDNQLHDISSEVAQMRQSLSHAQEEGLESSDQGTPTPTASPSPSPLPDQTEATLVELLQDTQWHSALHFAHHNRGMWPSELIAMGCEEDDITNILSVYCYHLVRENPDVFVVTEQDLGQVLSGLMEGLYQVLSAIKSFDTKVQDQRRAN
ncbi:hypothetical protein J6590_108208 [Homalodisca vitripennis]|nr:hypothetical protein J6590_108208 [Homalodisca vitripennis]